MNDLIIRVLFPFQGANEVTLISVWLSKFQSQVIAEAFKAQYGEVSLLCLVLSE